MSQTPHGASQRNHCPKTFRQLVVTGAYLPALLQPAKHALDDVALSVLGLVEQSGQARLGFTLHGAQRNHRLHPVAIAIAPKVFGIVALVRQEPATALARSSPLAAWDLNLIKQWLRMSNIAGLST